MTSSDAPDLPHHVVVNDEGQHSVWPAHRPVAPGWRAVGDAAPREDCLRRVEQLWTDMRPRSLAERDATAPGGDG